MLNQLQESSPVPADAPGKCRALWDATALINKQHMVTSHIQSQSDQRPEPGQAAKRDFNFMLCFLVMLAKICKRFEEQGEKNKSKTLDLWYFLKST